MKFHHKNRIIYRTVEGKCNTSEREKKKKLRENNCYQLRHIILRPGNQCTTDKEVPHACSE